MGHEGVLSLMSTLNAQAQKPLLIEGVIINGSYNPANGTVQAVMAHTVAAAAFQQPNGQQINPTVVGASLEVVGWDQYGPVGGERCLLAQCGTQWTAILEFDEDDSPGAPSGERWMLHRNPQNLSEITGYTKWTNDGATVGDNLAGFKNLVGGYASFVTTNGLSLVLNDTAGTITISAPGGSEVVLNTSGQLLLNGASASAGDALLRQSDLATAFTQLQTALSTWASTSLQGGSGASGPTIPAPSVGSSKSFSA